MHSNSATASKLAVFFASICISCGIEVGNPKKPSTGTGPAPSAVTSDNDIALELIKAQLDESLDALASSQSLGEDATLSLQSGGFSLADFSVESNCSEPSPGQAVVERTAAGTSTVRRNTRAGRFDIVTSGTSVDRNSWIGPAASVSCGAGQRTARIDFREADDLVLDKTFERNQSFSIARVATGAIVQSRSMTANGTRSYAWNQIAPSSGDVKSVSGSISSLVTRTATLTTARSGEQSITSEVRVASETPLITESDYSVTTGLLQRYAIESGTVTFLQADGTKIEGRFVQVEWLTGSGCQPRSGTFAGDVFASAESVDPHASFTVIFDGDDATISYSVDGEEVASGDYIAANCGFEVAP